MRKKTLFILIVLCVVAGIAGWWVRNRTQERWEQSAMGALFPDLSVTEVDRLRVSSVNDQVDLKLEDGIWRVAGAHDYPADQSRIRDLLLALRELKPIQRIPVDAKDLGRLDLNAPEEGESNTGTGLKLVKGTEELLDLRIGKEYIASGEQSASPWGGGPIATGRYIMVGDTSRIYLVSETFTRVSDDSNAWLDKSFLRADKARRIEGREGDKVLWSLERDSDSASLTLEGDIPEDKEVDSTKLNSVGAVLSYPSFNRVAPRAQATSFGLGDNARNLRVFEWVTFEGISYRVTMGERTDKGETPIMLDFDYTPPAMAEAPEDESDEAKQAREAAHEKKVAEAQAKVDEMKSRYQNWIYFIPNSTADTMLRSRDDLLKEKPKAADEPEETDGAGDEGAAPVEAATEAPTEAPVEGD